MKKGNRKILYHPYGFWIYEDSGESVNEERVSNMIFHKLVPKPEEKREEKKPSDEDMEAFM